MNARVADLVRKVCAYALAIALTLLLFRVLSRLAEGTLSAGDPALWGAVALATVGVLWVRAAKRMRGRAAEPPKDEPTDTF